MRLYYAELLMSVCLSGVPLLDTKRLIEVIYTRIEEQDMLAALSCSNSYRGNTHTYQLDRDQQPENQSAFRVYNR